LPEAVFRPLGRDEARKDGSLAIARDDRDDRRQHSLYPRRFPHAAAGEDVLHVDAEVNGVPDVGDF
jgi:hypothetical protein